MANATSTLVVKTEGIADAYKDISKILGPLQATNELIIQLNKTLQAVNEAVNRHSNVLDKLFPKGKAIIEVVGNIKAEINETSTSTTRMEKQLSLLTAMKVFDFLKEGFQTAKRFAEQLSNATLDATKNFNQWETSAKVLMQSLKSFPTTATFKGLTEWGSSVQFDMGVDSTEMNNLLSYSVQLGKTEDEIKQVTEAVMDFSAATGREAKDAVKAIGSALTGNIDALRRVNIYISDAEKNVIKYGTAQQKLDTVLGIFQARYKNAAREAANTSAGQLKTFQTIKSELERVFGLVLEPAFYGMLRVANELGQQLWKTVSDLTTQLDLQHSVLQSAADIFQKVGSVGYTAFETVYNVASALFDAVGEVYSGVKRFLGMLDRFADSILSVSTDWRLAFASMGIGLKFLWDLLTKFTGVGIAILSNMVIKIKMGWNNLKLWLSKGILTFFDPIGKKLSEKLNAFAEKVKDNALVKKLFGGEEAFEQTVSSLSNALNSSRSVYTDMALEIEGENSKLSKGLLDVSQYAKESWEGSLNAADKAIKEVSKKLKAADAEAKRLADEAVAWGEKRIKAISEYANRPGVPQVPQIPQIPPPGPEEHDAKQALKPLIDYAAQVRQLFETLGQTITNTFTEVFENMGNQAYDTRKAFFDMFQSLAKNVFEWGMSTLITNALTAASAAISQQASGPVGAIPFVGPAIAAGIGATLLAVISKYKNKMYPADIEYANGGYISKGMVRGGSYGKDSVRAMLMPGERVLSKNEARKYEEGGQPQNVSINVNVTGQLSTPSAVSSTVRQTLIPELRRALQAGYSL